MSCVLCSAYKSRSRRHVELVLTELRIHSELELAVAIEHRHHLVVGRKLSL